jgi:hypothetical protein
MSSLPATPLQEDDMHILTGLSIRVASIGLIIDCSKCGGAVPLTICQSDRSGNKGKPKARVCGAVCSTQCEPADFHPALQLRLFRWFPKLRDSPRILAAIPPLARSPDLSASSSSQSAAPAKTTKGRQPHKQGKPCGGPFCKRRGALKCGRAMCLKHCQEVILGLCLFHSHGG